MSVERTSAASSTELYNSTSLRGSGQRAPRYSISEMAPSKPTEVFVNKFAPATELSGAIQRTGEAFQYLTPNRAEWGVPKLIGITSN